MTKNAKIGLIAGASLPLIGAAIPLLFFPKNERQLYSIFFFILGLILLMPAAAGVKVIADNIDPKGSHETRI